VTLPRGQYVSFQSAVSLVGRRLNVTLEDGSVLVNVKLLRIEDRRWLFFDDLKRSVDLRCVSLLLPAAVVWDDSTLSQNFKHDNTAGINEWKRRHRCSAGFCPRDRLGNRLLGSKKCVDCSSLQEVS